MKAKVVFFLTLLISGLSLQAQTKTVELFNGENLDGWGFFLADETKKPEEVFTVKEGVIRIGGDPFGYMYTEDKYSNFHLSVEWRWPEEATNSGIFLYVQDENKIWPNSIECQLFAGYAGDFIAMGGTEIVAESGIALDRAALRKKNDSSENPVGEWNNADITCENGVITVYINGIFQNKAGVSAQKSGKIALQSEGKAIEFRHVRLTPLQ